MMVCVIGQEDYLERLKSYFTVLYPRQKITYISFPLLTEKPDKTPFNWKYLTKELVNIPREMIIYVAFSIKFHFALKEILQKNGFKNIIFYDSSLDNQLKKLYFKHIFTTKGEKFILLDELPNTHEQDGSIMQVYLAECVRDRSINMYPEKLPAEIIPIQVGAALTNVRIAEVTDNTGDNISNRNPHYSEMTAFYWIWKNAKADYLGICHYRRLWVDLEKIGNKLRVSDIDAVLPLPTLCKYSVYNDYFLRHIPDVWQSMMDVLKKQSPEYYKAANKIFKGNIFYASNMCILKHQVFNNLCEWMFPIVMEIEEYIGDLSDPYYNRYAGFCTERLITLYFLYNKQCWNIAHAEKIFIG
ncbi:DUF4422 domain-containing protein [Pectinatus frisingensis]|uniref:DUF4422 domain-containing protein n=1 Tax=Pectinatus frisingensis TaxID=865 RepID=UPI0018C7CFC5|nr:DUF4422 domain-containing protein [Pectinatus frisingensis]